MAVPDTNDGVELPVVCWWFRPSALGSSAFDCVVAGTVVSHVFLIKSCYVEFEPSIRTNHCRNYVLGHIYLRPPSLTTSSVFACHLSTLFDHALHHFLGQVTVISSNFSSRQHCFPLALFSWQKFSFLVTVALSFLFDKHCPITE